MKWLKKALSKTYEGRRLNKGEETTQCVTARTSAATLKSRVHPLISEKTNIKYCTSINVNIKIEIKLR